MPIQTKPTGLSGVPPPGPAMPVVEHETVLEHRDRTPAAIAKATGSLTAPCSSKTSCGTANNSCLMVLEYATTPPEYHVLEPGRSTNAAAHNPPVQDSAVEIVQSRVNRASRNVSTLELMANHHRPLAHAGRWPKCSGLGLAAMPPEDPHPRPQKRLALQREGSDLEAGPYEQRLMSRPRERS